VPLFRSAICQIISFESAGRIVSPLARVVGCGTWVAACVFMLATIFRPPAQTTPTSDQKQGDQKTGCRLHSWSADDHAGGRRLGLGWVGRDFRPAGRTALPDGGPLTADTD